ncbi:FMN-dependent oxidoreductase, nitrilotriacetate monooxygenase family [Bradyrhizobium shewense]|uniref:FMN-dependent oxidoreductase, nitrilotriacetate monooxygenase family n=1 Tax=Bradyrhizobium shewense TaxID=1761772 RepID=A0A1C3XTT3_9BRAD|nr:LLM class flavin-dependent oxidoreductase [Bradyrhizobium shewense]SCB55707.1 FMN-dependent oxidoreductase, nitrilotriacetate monooxygenase family [Bradyrhizobium shewense]
MSKKKQIVVGAMILANGTHSASWLMEEAQPSASTSIEYYRAMAQLAERGKLDFFMLADTPGAPTDNLQAWSRSPSYTNVLEPITLLSAVAGATTHIGLGATASTSFFEPYNLARQFASLDHISHGRAAWNVVTSANDYAARNFGLDRLPPHGERYAKAREFWQVVEALWDSWEDGAFVYDRSACLSFLPEKLHTVDHKGKYFTVQGALNIERTPQGRPVIIQAGASDAGRDFAAEVAEVVFGPSGTLGKAKEFYGDLQQRMGKFGRHPDDLKIASAITVVIGESEQEAHEKLEGWQNLIHPDVGVFRLGQDLGTDLSDLPLDQPVPEHRIPKSSNFQKAFFDEITEMIRERLTLRETARRYNRSKAAFCGTAAQVADHMESWIEAGACDGFMISFPALPSTLRDYVEKVVPELQRRGIFRTDYTGHTLRDHLGLRRPENRYASSIVSA